MENTNIKESLQKAKKRFALVNKYRKIMQDRLDTVKETDEQHEAFAQELEKKLNLNIGIYNLDGEYEPFSTRLIKQILREYESVLTTGVESKELYYMMEIDHDSDLTYYFTGVPHLNYDHETFFLVTNSLYGYETIA
jgi:hypothetical protein